MSEQSSQHLAAKLLAQLCGHAPEYLINQLTQACTRFAEACEDIALGYDLLSRLGEEPKLTAELSKCWVASEFLLDNHCRDVSRFLTLLDSGDLHRSYHLIDHPLDRSLETLSESNSDTFISAHQRPSVYQEQLHNKIKIEVGEK